MAQVTTNQAFVESRIRVGRYGTFGGFIVMFSGLYASFNNYILPAYVALLIGFVLFNVGAYFFNHYGWRAHERVAAALKGLDKRYHLYNFVLPAPHVLLTPYNVTVFLVKNVDGRIKGTASGWQEQSSLLKTMRFFSAEKLGNPSRDLEGQKERMREFIAAASAGAGQVPVDGYIIFTNPRAQVSVADVSAPVIVLAEQPDALKNALRRDKRAAQLPATDYNRLLAAFENEAEEKINQPQNLLSVFRR